MTDHEGIMVSEIRQTEKDEYCMISLTCFSEYNRTHRNKEQSGGYQRWEVEGWGT